MSRLAGRAGGAAALRTGREPVLGSVREQLASDNSPLEHKGSQQQERNSWVCWVAHPVLHLGLQQSLCVNDEGGCAFGDCCTLLLGHVGVELKTTLASASVVTGPLLSSFSTGMHVQATHVMRVLLL